jgi:CheY-like chemotaxis protein
VNASSPGVDQGATFTVRLPLLAAAGDGARGTGAAEGDEAEGSEAAHRLSGLRVAVVDDERDMRDYLSSSLREYGAEVTALATADEMLDALQSELPDVLVSDIAMPGDDGFALIRRVRALPAERGGLTPAVALTASSKSEDASRVLAAGYQVHLPKPVEPRKLAAVVLRLAAPVGEMAGPPPPLSGTSRRTGGAD